MRWDSQQMWFMNVKHLKSMSFAQIQKPYLGWLQNPKTLQKSKTVLQKKFYEWFGNETSQPMGFMTVLWSFNINKHMFPNWL